MATPSWCARMFGNCKLDNTSPLQHAYDAFVCMKDLSTLKRFEVVRKEFLRQHIESTDAETCFPFRHLTEASPNPELQWVFCDLFDFVHISGVHVLQYVLKAVEHTFGSGQWNQVLIERILRIFPHLHPLIFIIGWDLFSQDVKKRKLLVDALGDQMGLYSQGSKTLRSHCNYLLFQMQSAYFIANRMCSSETSFVDKTAADILNQLLSGHSNIVLAFSRQGDVPMSALSSFLQPGPRDSCQVLRLKQKLRVLLFTANLLWSVISHVSSNELSDIELSQVFLPTF